MLKTSLNPIIFLATRGNNNTIGWRGGGRPSIDTHVGAAPCSRRRPASAQGLGGYHSRLIIQITAISKIEIRSERQHCCWQWSVRHKRIRRPGRVSGQSRRAVMTHPDSRASGDPEPGNPRVAELTGSSPTATSLLATSPRRGGRQRGDTTFC